MTLSSTSGLGAGLGDYTGMVISIPKSTLNLLPTQSTIAVKITNNKFSKTYSTQINLASSISAPELVSIDAPILVNKAQEIQVKFVSLGEPSCALISYTLNSVVYYVGKFGTDSQTCSSYAKNTNYLGSYNKVDVNGVKIWRFNVTLNKIGYSTLNVNLINSFDTIPISTSVNVLSSLLDCENPRVSIENIAPYFYAPTLYKRNELFVVKSRTISKCNISVENSKLWVVYKIDEKTVINQYKVSLDDNPTMEYGKLLFYFLEILDFYALRICFKFIA